MLAALPTPIHPLPRLTERLGGPELWIKRDDLTGLAGGGNKTRKLEFLVGDALRQGADTLLTVGAIQSNHTRQTAAAAARVGLHCALLHNAWTPDAGDHYRRTGNVLLSACSVPSCTPTVPNVRWATPASCTCWPRSCVSAGGVRTSSRAAPPIIVSAASATPRARRRSPRRPGGSASIRARRCAA